MGVRRNSIVRFHIHYSAALLVSSEEKQGSLRSPGSVPPTVQSHETPLGISSSEQPAMQQNWNVNSYKSASRLSVTVAMSLGKYTNPSYVC